jgi:hypothetical protein
MESIDKRWLYAVLLVLTSIGLFIPVEVPVKPNQETMDLYLALSKVPTDKTILIQSDWTNSTRGENAGHFEALVRYLMAKKYKFAVYSFGDPQAPQVARDALTRIRLERKEAGLPEYKEWDDYLVIGYFPNAEAQTVSLVNNIRAAWSSKKIKDPTTRTERSPFESPVLKDVRNITDVGFVMIVTASATIDIAVERLSDKNVPMGTMCTGVVGPQVLPYHQAKQVTGVAVGLKGVYDFEYMMTYGVNIPDAKGTLKVAYPDKSVKIDPITEGATFGRGKSYFATLHIALTLLILAVFAGNLGLLFSTRGGKKV